MTSDTLSSCLPPPGLHWFSEERLPGLIVLPTPHPTCTSTQAGVHGDGTPLSFHYRTKPAWLVFMYYTTHSNINQTGFRRTNSISLILSSIWHESGLYLEKNTRAIMLSWMFQHRNTPVLWVLAGMLGFFFPVYRLLYKAQEGLISVI